MENVNSLAEACQAAGNGIVYLCFSDKAIKIARSCLKHSFERAILLDPKKSENLLVEINQGRDCVFAAIGGGWAVVAKTNHRDIPEAVSFTQKAMGPIIERRK